MATIKDQTFGYEMEFYGMTREHAVRVIANYFGGQAQVGFRPYYATDGQGRKWKVVYDGSIQNRSGDACEMVTPVLNYNDIEDLQEVIRELRRAGAKVNDSCGVHIHVGADKHDARSLKNLSNVFYSKQDILFRALKIHSSRTARWCKPLKSEYIEGLKNGKPSNLHGIGRIWYDSPRVEGRSKYDNSRYSALNLHSVFFTGTVEFRCFNSTTHAGRAKAYIQFVLAVSAQAINSRSARSTVTVSSNEKYTFRTWLLRLGLNGEEFKTCRHHMLANLEGNTAWRNAN